MKFLLSILLAASSLFGQTDLLSNSKPAGVKGGYTQKQVTVGANSTIDLLPTVTNSGYVDYLWVAGGDIWHQEVKVYVDGEVTPSIDMPYLNLFGAPYWPLSCCSTSFVSKWIGFNGGGYLRLPIPFTTSIHITLTNNTGSATPIWSEAYYQTGMNISTIPYTQKLNVVYTRNVGIAPNGTSTLLNVSPGKKGKLAGLVWLYDAGFGGITNSTAPLEGEFTILVDGSVAIQSSGTEDFFGMSGYFTGFTPPLTASESEGLLLKANSGVWSAYRFFHLDPVVFNSSLEIRWNCGMTSIVNFGGTCSTLSTVYYYTEN